MQRRGRPAAGARFAASRLATSALRSGGSWCGERVAVAGAVEGDGKTAVVAAVEGSIVGAADDAVAAVGSVRRACLQQLRGRRWWTGLVIVLVESHLEMKGSTTDGFI